MSNGTYSLSAMTFSRVMFGAYLVPLLRRQAGRLGEEEPAVHHVLPGRRLAGVPEAVHPRPGAGRLRDAPAVRLKNVLLHIVGVLEADDRVEAAVDVRVVLGGLVVRRLVEGEGR